MVVSTLSMPGLAARLPRCLLAVVGDALVVVEANVARGGAGRANSRATVVSLTHGDVVDGAGVR
jgi:hypothetical protein